MKLKILAFDQSSSRTGWAFGIPGENPKHGSFRSPKRDVIGERLAIIYDCAGELMDEFQPDLVAMETPFFPIDMTPRHDGESVRFSARVGTTHAKKGAAFSPKVISVLQKVAGIIELQTARRGIPLESYASRSWPPTILGGSVPRDADAKVMVRQRCRLMGMPTDSDDESDAIGIWWHAAHGAPASARAQGDLLAQAAARL